MKRSQSGNISPRSTTVTLPNGDDFISSPMGSPYISPINSPRVSRSRPRSFSESSVLGGTATRSRLIPPIPLFRNGDPVIPTEEEDEEGGLNNFNVIHEFVNGNITVDEVLQHMDRAEAAYILRSGNLLNYHTLRNLLHILKFFLWGLCSCSLQSYSIHLYQHQQK